ncbi:MAG: BrnT family toxin [Chloroflexota bacterium]|nr:BrnT family toxin [Chloroflexota bacterium]
MPIEYEWDEGKRLSNKLKHGVDFSEVTDLEWETAVIQSSPRGGEIRYTAMGFIHGRLHFLVFTTRSGNLRIVSLRKANRRERIHYERQR